jgi:small subunit ribosomal protein S7
MPRHPIQKKRIVFPDPIYNSISVHMLVNRVMKNGKISLEYKIVYNTFKNIGETTEKKSC